MYLLQRVESQKNHQSMIIPRPTGPIYMYNDFFENLKAHQCIILHGYISANHGFLLRTITKYNFPDTHLTVKVLKLPSHKPMAATDDLANPCLKNMTGTIKQYN